MPLLAGPIRRHRADLDELETDGARRSLPVRLLIRVASAFPRHERAAENFAFVSEKVLRSSIEGTGEYLYEANANTASFHVNFPSGSIYPVQAFPTWLRAIATVDPFTYAVHGFKALLLKESGLVAILPDVLYLSIFAVITLALAVPLFKRTL